MKRSIFILPAVLMWVLAVQAAERKSLTPEPVKQPTVERIPMSTETARNTILPAAAEAQDLSVNWSVIAGGGGQVTSGSLTVNGTIGQSAVGTVTSTSNIVHAGFWQNFDDLSCCVDRGNVDHVVSSSGAAITIADLTYLVAMVFRGGADAPCLVEADLNADGAINIQDITFLVALLFRGGPDPAPCP